VPAVSLARTYSDERPLLSREREFFTALLLDRPSKRKSIERALRAYLPARAMRDALERYSGWFAIRNILQFDSKINAFTQADISIRSHF
jgi:hypothetical protein